MMKMKLKVLKKKYFNDENSDMSDNYVYDDDDNDFIFIE